MSGTNPFRRKDSTKQLSTERNANPTNSAVIRPATYVPSIDTNVPKTPKSKIGKTVRIISPHSATPDPEHESPVTNAPPLRSLSPAPELISREHALDDDVDDPFRSGLDQEAINSGPEESLPDSVLHVKNNTENYSRSSSNPFKKTIPTVGQVGVNAPTQLQATNAQKPQYGVEEFKTLLLTGEKTLPPNNSTAAPAVSFPNQLLGADTSSNTDTSSISRVSLFDATLKQQSESPRTSQEISPSDDESHISAAASPMKAAGAKPSAPRHRHGKLVKASAPETVPFEDSAFSPTDIDLSSAYSQDQLMLDTSRSRHNALGSVVVSAESDTTSQGPSQKEAGQAQRDPLSHKKSPPAPPPSRRHGQPRPSSFVPEAARSLPITEESRSEAEEESQSPVSNLGKPRPPPPRRARSVRHDSSSSIPTTGSFTPLSDQSTPTRAPLQTPPTRSPSIAATQKPAHPSPQSSSPSMPPPPPPRRRGSSLSNYTPSRLSGDYRNLLSQRPRGDSGSSSISQLQMPPPESTSDKKDVLADLSALQREVDELRGKINR
ncbi:uncharacterized protein KY384_005978 [Bacidia gigantensis]|uniref:uncharacterized protein n=1 Tax=Bacidia gigantensis TaxID=2732470 RepID=UPI001D052598|nr:uncharacterized protein KY384_005978 [Bacidia gigantensis]KAG8529342.1 hypothetical protein KY384_005978 [Bacidia gigantensis]